MVEEKKRKRQKGYWEIPSGSGKTTKIPVPWARLELFQDQIKRKADAVGRRVGKKPPTRQKQVGKKPNK